MRRRRAVSMLSKTNWKAWLVLGAAVALVLASGVVMASNVGFKINKGLKTPFLAPGPAGDNWISLPYNSPYNNFTNLCNAFFAAGAPKANTTISRLDASTGLFTHVSCLAGSAAPLVPGQGLRARITTVTLPSVILVGSSNEATAFPTFFGGFIAPGPKGDNWAGYPYHTTWVKASDVCGSLGLGLGQGTVSRIDP